VLVLANAEAQLSDISVADSLYAIGNYTTAINEYAKVASPKAELQIARAYNAIGNYEKAMLQYENIVQKNESQELATYELGRLYLKLKKFHRWREPASVGRQASRSCLLRKSERFATTIAYYYYGFGSIEIPYYQ